MKKIEKIIIGILLAVTILQGSMGKRSLRIQLNETTDSLTQVLSERNQLDSLYREHLSECSFISKKEVAVDSRGYFYSTYKNNPIKINK